MKMKDKKELATNMLIGILVLAIVAVVGFTLVILQKNSVLLQETATEQV